MTYPTLDQANEWLQEAVEQHNYIGLKIATVTGKQMTRDQVYEPQHDLHAVMLRLYEIAASAENDNLLLAMVRKNKLVQERLLQLSEEEVASRIVNLAHIITMEVSQCR